MTRTRILSLSLLLSLAAPALAEPAPFVHLQTDKPSYRLGERTGVKQITLTVAGLQNGSDELLHIDGEAVALTHGNAVTTTSPLSASTGASHSEDCVMLATMLACVSITPLGSPVVPEV